MKRIYLSLFCILFVAGFYGAANALTIPATVGVSPASSAATIPGQGVTMAEGNRKAAFYFNMSGLPSGAALNTATLRLLLPEVPNAGSSLSVYKISGVWMQQSSSFGPLIDAVPVASIPGSQVPLNRVVEVDVTSVVKNWANAPTGVEGFLVTGSFGEGGGPTVPLNFDGATTFGLTASLEVNPQESPANGTVDPYEQWPGILKSRVVSPVITVQPWVTSAGSLSVSAHGAGALGYQWYRNGVAIPGATGAQLATVGLQSGSYVVRVQNGYGAVNSGVFAVGGEETQLRRFGSFKTVSFNWGAYLAIKEDGTLWAWGSNSQGQLGLGYSNDVVSTPTQIGMDADWSSIVSNDSRGYGIKTDGTLWGWGYNQDGRLGLGTSGASVLIPTQVGSDRDWATVVSSDGGTFGLKKDGTLWAWGYNWSGLLGLGTSDSVVSTPMQVGSDGDWESIVTNGSTFGLKKDGTLWAWGYNWSGLLGLGNTSASVLTPTQVGSATDWASIVGRGSNFGIRKDGTLWAWGHNSNGVLGVGSSENVVTIPTQVGTDSDWASVVSWGSNFGIRKDGTLWAWGNNYNGVLGVGSSENAVTTPTQVGTDSDWASIVVNGSTFGLKKDGTLWAWGYNQDGGLGIGTSGPFVSTPTQIGADSNWNSIIPNYAERNIYNFAFKSDGSLWAWGYNWNGSLGTGSMESPLTTPTKIESTVPWKLPSTFQIDTNSPSPAGVPVPRIRTGSPLALKIAAPEGESVAAVEWYIDGTRIRTVRSAPWAATVQAPSLGVDAQSQRLVVEARVLNSSGQLMDTVRQEMDVVRDPISPVVVGLPSVVFGPSGTSVSLSFSKTLDAAPVAGAFKVLSAGTDGLLGSPDDMVVPSGTVSINGNTAWIYFPNGLGAGRYRLVVDGRLLDSVGNPLGSKYVTDFVNSTSVWVGGVGYWADPANWSGGVVPFSEADVVFPVTGGNHVVVGSGQNSVSLRSLRVQGETALVGMNLSVAQSVSLSANLIFSGTNNLEAGGILENLLAPGGEGANARARYRIKVKAGVWTDSLVPGQTSTRSGLLRFGSGLTLVDNLEVETAGMDGSTQLEVDSSLNLRGKTLRVLGGYAGSLKFGTGVSLITGQSGFEITGPGKIALDWEESVLANSVMQSDRLSLNVSAPAFVLPPGVELSVAGRGKVTVNSPGFTNAGVVRVANGGYLKAFNYTKTGENSSELVVGNGVLEKVIAERKATLVKTASFVNGANLMIKEDGTLWAWGSNWSGQLGLGSNMDVAVPTQVGTDTGWSSVVTNGKWSYGLKTDGTLWAWGENFQGQLGIGTSGAAAVSPQQVGESSDWAMVVPSHAYSGASFAFGIKTDGTLWAWGQNGSGELAIGTSGLMVTSPAQVGTDSNWASVIVGYGSTYGLKSDGTLWAWGQNFDGQLGTGTSGLNLITPTQVGQDSNWASVVNEGATFGLKTDGTLWAWGYNMMGELGIGSSGSTVRTPTQVGQDSNWASIVSAGVTFALKTDGTLWAWGYNEMGELGIGSSGSNVTTPTQVGTDQDWASVATWGFNLGLKRNGTLWAWGNNMSGQLGLGSSGPTVTTPTQVGSSEDWSAVFVGNGSFGLKSDGSLWAWGYNWNGSLGTGSMMNPLTTPTKIESLVPWKISASRP